MPIKQIQLRGISRTPSDRMTADGGLAEALNVHLEDNEQAPTLPPDDITDLYFHDISYTGPSLYIHKGLGYDNLVFLYEEDSTVMATPKESGTVMTLFQLNSEEIINGVKSVGNTLVFSTNQRMMYVLYKDEDYKALGEQIPIPALEFHTRQYPTIGNYSVPVGNRNTIKTLIESFTPSRTTTGSGRTGAGGPRSGGGIGSSTTVSSVPRSDYDGIKGWNLGTWKRYLDGETDTVEYDESYAEVVNDIWDMIKAQINYVKSHGYFCTPVFARYAIQLYDGTYTYQSVPILLGAGDYDFMHAYGYIRRYSESTTYSSNIAVRLNSAYEIKAFLSDYNYDGWEDIVKSIDIFLSTDIHTPLLNSVVTGIEEDEDASYSDPDGDTYLQFNLFFNDENEDIEDEKRRDEILSKTNFYRIATFPIGNLGKLMDGFNLMAKKGMLSDTVRKGNDSSNSSDSEGATVSIDDMSTISQDVLVVQPELPDDYLSFHKKRADDLFQYNNKVIMTGVSQEITTGYQFMNGSVVRVEDDAANEQVWQFKFAFYMRDSSNNSLVVFGRTPETTNNEIYESTYHDTIRGIVHSSQEHSAVITEIEHYSRPFGWLAYPDPRCYMVDIQYRIGTSGVWQRQRYKMEAHPGLNCAYVFIGLENPIGTTSTGETTPVEYPTEEKRLFNENNIIWASEINNPFVFPAAGRLSFHAEVISLANATRALSEGQFGQFPLYVFTKDGIWSVPLSDTGNFMASVPMSRDVALSKNTIQSLEQAIVFATSQGVMLLQGSGVENIAPYMNGRHYLLEEDVKELLRNSPWGDMSSLCESETTFMGFINGAKIAYDYNGRRIIFSRDGFLYMYVYYIATSTWHKIVGAGTEYGVLNSYPDCYVAIKNTLGEHKIYNYSTVLDDASRLSDSVNPIKGIIITRPFDLGEPDIRKAITQVRIRGKYNKNDVQYVLLGSFDDIHWKRLRSLRGGSYKLFRMILLCNLSPTERISWIDIDYESRFTNKLR